MAAHVFAVALAQEGEIREIGGTVGKVDDNAADVFRFTARGAHDFHDAAQRAVPLRDEVADRPDLPRNEQHAAALWSQHAVIPAAGPRTKCFGVDDLERHSPQPAIVTAVPL